MKIFLGIVYIVICAFIMGVVLKQEGKQQGLGAIGGGAGNDTYWAKNKGRSREGVLKRMTVIAAALFILLSIGLNMMFRGDTTTTIQTTDGAQEINMDELTELINQSIEENAAEEGAVPGDAENSETTMEVEADAEAEGEAAGEEAAE